MSSTNPLDSGAVPMTNREQIELWSGKAGERWVQQQDVMDRCVGPLGLAAMDAAKIISGESVLDVGCGCGDTTLAIAERVGSRGRVLGIDISKPMLARARERAAQKPASSAAIEFSEADAAVAELPQVDLAYSRFGVMFFADPLLAFGNIHRAARRLAFVTWRTAAENEWVSVIGNAIAPHLPAPAIVAPGAPGPHSLSDKNHLDYLLRESGYREVSIASLDLRLHWSRSPDLAAGVKFFTQIGPAARALAEAERPARSAAIIAMTEALAPHQTESGLQLGSAVWIVTAS